MNKHFLRLAQMLGVKMDGMFGTTILLLALVTILFPNPKSKDLINRYAGSRLVVDPNQRAQIEFPNTFDKTTENLNRLGFYSGFP